MLYVSLVSFKNAVKSSLKMKDFWHPKVRVQKIEENGQNIFFVTVAVSRVASRGEIKNGVCVCSLGRFATEE